MRSRAFWGSFAVLMASPKVITLHKPVRRDLFSPLRVKLGSSLPQRMMTIILCAASASLVEWSGPPPKMVST